MTDPQATPEPEHMIVVVGIPNTAEPLIDPERVNAIWIDCLYDDLPSDGDGKPIVPDDAIIVEGIMQTAGWDPVKVAGHRDEIDTMLDGLPEGFGPAGGGWSFLQACQDRNDNQWTGLHMRMEQLFMLGQAIGRVKNLLPREMWGMLPGGMPYYVVNDRESRPLTVEEEAAADPEGEPDYCPECQHHHDGPCLCPECGKPEPCNGRGGTHG